MTFEPHYETASEQQIRGAITDSIRRVAVTAWPHCTDGERADFRDAMQTAIDELIRRAEERGRGSFLGTAYGVNLYAATSDKDTLKRIGEFLATAHYDDPRDPTGDNH